ncbi:conserved membrane hypothetical protein [anaerobic digester metagenome]|uniref:Ammonia monooxygenase n=1 Tax=anaerobic digester metagenome TaxID=1263854 RepID=A0A485M5Q2_9ZZZZ
MLNLLQDLFILFFFGICGWALFTLLRLPVAALLGTITFIGILRILEFPLPFAPNFLLPLVQVFLGLYVGTKVTRDTVRQLKTMVLPAIIIVFWALSVVFLLGIFLARITPLDPITSILSSSMGGLPEMTVIALATNAEIAVIIVMQTFRMVVTALAFPFILKVWMKGKCEEESECGAPLQKQGDSQEKFKEKIAVMNLQTCLKSRLYSYLHNANQLLHSAGWNILSLVIGGSGGFLFLYLGVPAGAMVGSMFFIASASLMGVPVTPPSPRVFGLMLVGVGLMVSDNISSSTMATILSGNLLIPIIVSTVLIFLSSLLVAFLIHKLMGWDFPTSFLAAAPGGFTVMTSLAIKYKKDPLRVSMLHLCRLLALKSVVPFVFMFLI